LTRVSASFSSSGGFGRDEGSGSRRLRHPRGNISFGSTFPEWLRNQAFDRSLRHHNPTWGLRHLEAVAAIAQSVGFSVPTITEMPANNLSVVFHRL
jgi:hypothetical protein